MKAAQIFYLLLLFLRGLQAYDFRMRILQTPIFHFLPDLKLHHIVVLENKNENENIEKGVYTVDFTPIHQSHLKTQLKLLLSYNVPAEVRLRRIDNVNFNETDEIVSEWNSMNERNEYQSEKLSHKTYDRIHNSEIKSFISLAKKWDKSMNVYTHNCQHFSSYAKRIYDSDP